MKNNKKAETLIWFLVVSIILAMTITWIISIAKFNNSNNELFYRKIEKKIIKRNIENIMEKIDTDSINEWAEFYISNESWNIQLSLDNNFIKKTSSLENIKPNYDWLVYRVTLIKLPKIEWINLMPEINIDSI